MGGNKVQTSWLLYGFLCLVRISACFLSGYIHPDEFYQGGQELFYGTVVPWEFDPSNAIRSIIPPLFMTKLPLMISDIIMKLIFNDVKEDRESNSEWLILVVPRLFMVMLSFLTYDYIVWKIVRSNSKEADSRGFSVPNEVLIISSSWAVIIFSCRPFTNTLESMILNAVLLLGTIEVSVQKLALSIGILFGVGIFTRFTFVFYALPIILSFIFSTSREHQKNFSQVFNRFFFVIMGSGLIAIIIVVVDVMYYEADTICYSNKFQQIYAAFSSKITPLNALIYNSNVGNLSSHGLHPRITHLLVNMPMLFGPLAVYFYVARLNNFKAQSNRIYSSSIVCGLALLSMAPHQEPRFLLPVITPLVLLHSRSIAESRIMLILWIAHNSIMFLFFGFFHQAGIIPSLLSLNTSPTSKLIFYHTYMPPSFLLRDELKSNIIDLKGSGIDILEQTLSGIVGNCREGYDENIFLFSPPTALMGVSCYASDTVSVGNFVFVKEDSYFNLSTEDFPTWCGNPWEYLISMELVKYNVFCK